MNNEAFLFQGIKEAIIYITPIINKKTGLSQKEKIGMFVTYLRTCLKYNFKSLDIDSKVIYDVKNWKDVGVFNKNYWCVKREEKKNEYYRRLQMTPTILEDLSLLAKNSQEVKDGIEINQCLQNCQDALKEMGRINELMTTVNNSADTVVIGLSKVAESLA